MSGNPGRDALSFRWQLTLWFGALSLITLIGATIYIGSIATRNLASFNGEALYRQSRAAADRLAIHLEERRQEIELLSQAPLFTQGDLKGTGVRQALELRKAYNQEYAWVGITDADGQVTQASDGLLVGQQVSQRPWFQAGRERVFVGDVHEAVLLSKHLPNAHPDQPLRFIDFAAPVYDNAGELRGVLGAHAHWSWVTDTVRAVIATNTPERQVEFLIADAQGNILYPYEQAGEFLAPVGKATGRGSSRIRWAETGEYLTSIAPLMLSASARLDWYIIVRQPIQAALAPVRELQLQLLLFGALTVLLFTLLAYRLASKVSRPIERLAQATQAVEYAQTPPRFPAERHAREINQLIRSIRTMTLSLLQQQQDLAALNSSLEQQVQNRTRELSEANAALAQLANRDGLTGLLNRRAFDDKLRELFLLSQRTQAPLSALLIDADHFKRVNDTHGHQVGDQVLQQLAGLIQAQVRATDYPARYGGEEFVVLLPDTSAEEARTVAEKLRTAVAQDLFPAQLKVTISLGASLLREADLQPEQLIERADQALYSAKQQGRNRCVQL